MTIIKSDAVQTVWGNRVKRKILWQENRVNNFTGLDYLHHYNKIMVVGNDTSTAANPFMMTCKFLEINNIKFTSLTKFNILA